MVGGDSGDNLENEYDSKQEGIEENHAVTFLDSTTASKKCNKEDEASKDDDVERNREEMLTKEVQILAIGHL